FREPTPLAIARALPPSAEVSRVHEEILYLTEAETQLLARSAQRAQITSNTLAQGAWALLLAQYSGAREVLFGVTVAGRPTELEGIQDTVGLFINTIPLRTQLPEPSARRSVLEFLKGLLHQNLTMRQFEHVPLVEIQALSELPRGLRLFDSLFVFENAPLDNSLFQRKYDLQARLTSQRTHTNYPLTIVVTPGAQVELRISFDARLFELRDVQRMLNHYRTLLMQMAEQPERLLWALPHVSAAEAVVQERANATARAYPLQAGYPALFAAQVKQHGARCAVRAGAASLSYAELANESDRVASALVHAGLEREGLVGVLMPRGLPLVAAAIGTFQAGGVYLPLDPQQPNERLAQVLALAKPRVLLVTESCHAAAEQLLSLLDSDGRPELLVYQQLAAAEPFQAVAPLPEQLAYVIYTSGSTGTPKGAMVTMAGMLNNQLSKLPFLGLTDQDVVAQTAAQSFDISVWQLLAALLCGGRVEIVADEVAHDAQALLGYVAERGITVLESVPSLVAAMLNSDQRVDLGRLRYLLPTGEALTPELSRRWLGRYPGVPLVNAYGPAECADDVALHMLTQAPPGHEARVPIGKPTDNNRLYILNPWQERVALGVVGEICVAGVGVGRGYLASPGRTAEAFVPNPFGQPGERLYRTGDLGRYRTDGTLEYVGRRDQQVKVRGYRIELGEIEARLSELPGVRDVAVLAREDVPGQKRLVAYVVAETEDEALRQNLRRVLPDYMVPQLFVRLAQLPKLISGKLDRKALPAPDLSLAQRVYAAPRNALERELTQIWAATLGVERVGLDDDFFELGGDSIIALQLVGRAKSAGIELSPRQVLQQPTLRALAELATTTRAPRAVVEGPELSVGEDIPMLPIQRWFFDQGFPNLHHWNQSVMLDIPTSVELRRLETALAAV
ncbi:MAG: hypothetical protein RL701_7295, partial [Pseudomonadota bacterium]